jgi:hypothetical protein
MTDLTLPLAIFNLLPVLLNGVALLFLVRLVRQQMPAGRGAGARWPRRWAVIGALLVFAGGLSKAAWKLILVLTEQDVAWLGSLLFPLLGPGFVLLAAAIWAGGRRLFARAVPDSLSLSALALILLTAAAVAVRMAWLDIPRGWFMPLLLLTTAGSLTLSLVLIALSARLRLWVGAALFAVNLAMMLVLPAIAMIEPKTLGVHWLEQSLTAAAGLCFAVAAWLLLRQTRFGRCTSAVREHKSGPIGSLDR